MKKLQFNKLIAQVWFVFLIFSFTSCTVSQSSSQKSTPKSQKRQNWVIEKGEASYYADKFHGKPTASGQKYDKRKYTAAHRTLPFGTEVEVINLNNGKSIIVQINDRGPHKKSRIIDLSRAAATEIDLIQVGIAPVEIRYKAPESQ